MQQQTPPQGRLFPDPPQGQQQASPRFASNSAQLHMQHSGQLPVYHSARYASGMMPVMQGQPVQTMPPMATMPTAQAYQASQQGEPVIVQTVQGMPVLVTVEQLQAALDKHRGTQEEQEPKPTRRRRTRKTHDEAADDKPDRKKSAKNKKDKKDKKEKKPLSFRLSVVWFIFGLIGMGTVGVTLIRLVVNILIRMKGAL